MARTVECSFSVPAYLANVRWSLVSRTRLRVLLGAAQGRFERRFKNHCIIDALLTETFFIVLSIESEVRKVQARDDSADAFGAVATAGRIYPVGASALVAV